MQRREEGRACRERAQRTQKEAEAIKITIKIKTRMRMGDGAVLNPEP
jgi:hypothetical protein